MPEQTRSSKKRVVHKAKPMTERRRAPRANVKLLVAFRAAEGDASPHTGFARALNLSVLGVLLESPDPFNVGQSISLELLLDNDRIAPVTGQVTRVDPRGQFYLVAVAFSKVPAKIKGWIKEQIKP